MSEQPRCLGCGTRHGGAGLDCKRVGVYPGLRGDPKFSQLLADYDRVSELLGDAQRDLNATTAERSRLAGELASTQEHYDALLESNRHLRFSLNKAQDNSNTLRALVGELVDALYYTDGNLEYGDHSELIARARAAINHKED